MTIGVGIWQLQVGRQRLAAEARPATGAPSRSVAPDFALPTADGQMVRLKDLRGQVVLLNFWATWCPPCKAEMPDLDALHREYGARHRFTVLGINMEENAEVVAGFAQQRGITFPLLLDTDGRVSNKLFVVRSLPTSMIIDREGFIRDAWTGQISKEAMLARLQRVW
ncbi:MAG: TlpA family protein disulfide reductase [Anaerolineae bacterium]